jgi:hypothetical protein
MYSILITEQVNYFRAGASNWPDPIFLTIGKYLLVWYVQKVWPQNFVH